MSTTPPFEQGAGRASSTTPQGWQSPGSAAEAQLPSNPNPYASHGAGTPGIGPQPPAPPSTPTQQPAPNGPRPRKPRTVLTVVTAAVLAATLASGGTAYLLRDDAAPGSAGVDTGIPQVPGVSSAVDGSPDWEAVAAATRPSVVAIDVQVAQGEAAGSGVILDVEGRILTNNHVVEGATSAQVMLWDGRIYEARVVGTDPPTDLAVLQIAEPPEDLTPATLGTSADLAVGEPVMAVGNPLGLDNTVTTGIISALDRPVAASSQSSSSTSVTNAIQIDAAINPGNSGGPLFDEQGLVIGITSSIATLSGGGGASGSIGLGFAIPIDLATTVADQLIADGQAEHAYLGVTLQAGEGSADGVTRQGAQVVEVMPDTPAAGAGLEPGDVVIGIDDHAVGSAESLTGFVRQYLSGDEVILTVIRGGESIELPVTLATRPEG